MTFDLVTSSDVEHLSPCEKNVATEEWLSEGFATFLEDILYERAMRLTFPEKETSTSVTVGLQALLRLHKLQSELLEVEAGSEDNLGTLAPSSAPIDPMLVKNGLVPMKQFLQVHYLKGYFFLHYLSEIVGLNEFLRFLKSYVLKFQGSLVTSAQFLNNYQEFFDSVVLSVEKLIDDWLVNPKLIEPLRTADVLNDKETNSKLFRKYNCTQALERIAGVFQTLCSDSSEPITEKLSSLELTLLFEKIVNARDTPFASKRMRMSLQNLQSRLSFQPEEHNPEVLHRWCEIIVKFYQMETASRSRSKAAGAGLKTLKNFLLDHPAMGVYLYGELMISEKRQLQDLARSLYFQQIQVLDPEARHVLRSMIF